MRFIVTSLVITYALWLSYYLWA